MIYAAAAGSLALAGSVIPGVSAASRQVSQQITLAEPTLAINGIPFSTRVHWMRKANEALTIVLDDPCPFAAFGTAIVNHTDTSGLGELVCLGANSNSITGNPTLHGEMAAINNCTKILTDPSGPYGYTPSEAQEAFTQLSLYTNGESCPMCAAAIQWTGFREYIYGTSIDTLIKKGWDQIRIPSYEIFQQAFDQGSTPRIVAEVLTNETDPLFQWQFDPEYKCPKGCGRVEGSCMAHGK